MNAVPPDAGGPELALPEARGSGSRSALPRWVVLAALLGVVALLAASWFALPIKSVSVTGNRVLSPAQVKQLAGASEGFGWLYYGTWRARGLLGSPWVASAVVTRRFPNSVEIAVKERVPAMRWQGMDGRIQVLALDGTVLPGARGTDALPLVGGWGPDRLPEAVRVLGILRDYNVKSVMYSPVGVTVKFAQGSLWSGDLESLVKYAGSISMYPSKHIKIYPWGVSVQE